MLSANLLAADLACRKRGLGGVVDEFSSKGPDEAESEQVLSLSVHVIKWAFRDIKKDGQERDATSFKYSLLMRPCYSYDVTQQRRLPRLGDLRSTG